MLYQCSLSLQLVRCMHWHAHFEACTNECTFVPQEMLNMTESKQQTSLSDEASKTPTLPPKQSTEMLPVSSTKHGIIRSISKPGTFKGAC